MKSPNTYNKKHAAFFSDEGVGGRKCYCCATAQHKRKKADRTGKRREKFESMKDMWESANDGELGQAVNLLSQDLVGPNPISPTIYLTRKIND